MKEFIENFYKKKYFWPRLIVVVLAVTMMGFCMSLLINVAWGTDPCTSMNRAISARIGMSFGNWQALFNCMLLVIVLFCGGRNIGFGTFVNMFLVGYSIDFFNMVWKKVLSAEFFEPMGIKIAVFLPALLVFVIAVGVYVEMDLGTAPYDAIPIIISNHMPAIESRWVRMAFDFTVIVLGVLFGGKLQIVTVLMALLLGPAIGFAGKLISKKWNFEQEN